VEDIGLYGMIIMTAIKTECEGVLLTHLLKRGNNTSCFMQVEYCLAKASLEELCSIESVTDSLVVLCAAERAAAFSMWLLG
jgi:hypothetical protein